MLPSFCLVLMRRVHLQRGDILHPQGTCYLTLPLHSTMTATQTLRGLLCIIASGASRPSRVNGLIFLYILYVYPGAAHTVMLYVILNMRYAIFNYAHAHAHSIPLAIMLYIALVMLVFLGVLLRAERADLVVSTG